jgi:hypothetical protein
MVMHLEKRSAISNNFNYLGSFEKLHELLNNDHAHYIISINSLIIHLQILIFLKVNKVLYLTYIAIFL